MADSNLKNGRIALIAITKKGAVHAEKTGAALENVDVYISAKFKKDGAPDFIKYFETTSAVLIPTLFPVYDGIVFFISLGAVVRMISGLLKDKHTDPAVVVVDDEAQYAISVLSGHLGGANALTEKVAGILSAKAVITTASDVGKTIAVDLLGKEFGWAMEQAQNVTKVSGCVVNQEKVAIYQDAGEKNWWKRETPLPVNFFKVDSLDKVRDGSFKAALLITDREIPDADILAKSVVYRPKTLVLGLGCDRGVDGAEMDSFIRAQLKQNGWAFLSIRNLATIDLKSTETSILDFSKNHNLPVDYFTSQQLDNVEAPTPSDVVKSFTGTKGVSEPSALLSSKGTLVLPKVKTARLTLAIGRVSHE